MFNLVSCFQFYLETSLCGSAAASPFAWGLAGSATAAEGAVGAAAEATAKRELLIFAARGKESDQEASQFGSLLVFIISSRGTFSGAASADVPPPRSCSGGWQMGLLLSLLSLTPLSSSFLWNTRHHRLLPPTCSCQRTERVFARVFGLCGPAKEECGELCEVGWAHQCPGSPLTPFSLPLLLHFKGKLMISKGRGREEKWW